PSSRTSSFRSIGCIRRHPSTAVSSRFRLERRPCSPLLGTCQSRFRPSSRCYVQSMISSPGERVAPASVGLCLHQPRRRVPLEPFWMQFLRGAEDVLAERGMTLLLKVVVDLDDEMATLRRWHETGQVAGVIVSDLAPE